MRTWALIADSLREIYARKVIIGIVIIELVTLTITTLILFSDDMQRNYEDARLTGPAAAIESRENGDAPFAGDDSLLAQFDSTIVVDSALVDTSTSRSLDIAPPPEGRIRTGGALFLRETVRGQLGAFSIPTVLATLFLGIFAASGIVPSMMEKGTIDLLLSKPLPRWKLLWGRAAGGALAVGSNLVLFATAICVLYGTATGVWYWPFVSLTFLFGFGAFLTMYAFVIVLNVLTESWVLPMSLAYVHVVIFSGMLSSREAVLFEWIDSPFLRSLITGLYYLLPQTADLSTMTPTSVLTGSVFDWAPLVHSGVFIVVMVALATWLFQRRDF